MKNALSLAIAAAAALTLAACENKPEEVTSTAPDPMASQLANAAPVELPPAMTASKTLRCGDNSLIYVNFFQGDKQAQVRTSEKEPFTMLKAAEAGQPYEGEGGWKLSGSPSSVSVTIPGKGTKTCHA